MKVRPSFVGQAPIHRIGILWRRAGYYFSDNLVERRTGKRLGHDAGAQPFNRELREQLDLGWRAQYAIKRQHCNPMHH